MITLATFWTLPIVLILALQYSIGEWYLIKKKHRYRLGYAFVVVIMLIEIAYGVYVMKVVDYMEAFGIAYLILSSFLFHKFVKRFIRKVHIVK